ncbi:MAG: KUP/HAK/KT family potassium transporter [Chitinophagales bacterium]|nr:KUP/HAK/KT family potassium transporter [Chitinophagales bacterium]
MDIHSKAHKLSAAGLLITLGIIYGDIGTSPLYVMKAIVGDDPINSLTVLGGISAVFWTLTLQTTLKYVTLTLQADNKGEGGIFSLYALVRRTKRKWLILPAIIGGCTLLADGIITPPISVASAVEGLRVLPWLADIPTVPIVIAILVGLFVIQQFGTKRVGNLFGPIMLVWFCMLGALGISQIATHWAVLKALNPYYAYQMIVNYPGGFWLLGAVFLCTTGAEALYSDLGHCGKQNIRISWVFVKTMLLLNYFGQGAWLLKHEGQLLPENPFYGIMPEWFVIPGIIIATCAAVVASQALLSGSFTLINEAIRLNFWPKMKINYPTDLQGQLYIPFINWLLLAGCIGVVLHFEESSAMEAAYGLAIVLTMLMTSTLLVYYMFLKRFHIALIIGFILTYGLVETAFLVANLEKFTHGGFITLIIGGFLFSIMWVWYNARRIRNRYVEFVKLEDYLVLLRDLSNDGTVSKYATHLVYLTSANNSDEIESKIMYSILQKQPKRADIYWFVHVDVVDEPYKMSYKIETLLEQDVIRVDFKLGFRVAPRINLFFRKVVEDLVRNDEVDITSRYASLNKNNIIGDFRFVVIEKVISHENELPFYENLMLDMYEVLKMFSLSEEKAFGLDTSSVEVEKVPLVISPGRDIKLKRIKN